MSRCFPFPPPGYESQLRSDNNVDLLEKEKHKEKKHKKERRDKEKKEGKDKEKKEGKERKDKERSKDKQKEKKDRKEKHKDKKKDKDKYKVSSQTSEDRTKEQTEGQHEINVGESSRRVDEVKDSKFTEDLGRRIRDEEKGATNSMAENFTVSFRRKEGLDATATMEMGRVTCAEMVPGPIGISQRRNAEKGRPVENFVGSIERSEGMDVASAMAKNRSSSNHMVANLDSTQKSRNHATGYSVDNLVGSMQERSGGMCSGVVEKDRNPNKVSNTLGAAVPDLIGKEQKKNNAMGRQVVNIPKRVEGICTATPMEKGRGKDQPMVPQSIIPLHGRNDGMGHLVDPTASKKESGEGNQMVARNISLEQTRNNILGGPMEKSMDNSMEGKWKPRVKEADDLKVDKHGDRDKNEKKNKGNDKDMHKEKEKEDKMREKGEHKHHKKSDKLREIGKKDPVDNPSIKPLTLHKENANSDAKRKDFKMNGFLHENEAWPNKLLKTSSLLHPHSENGRKSEPCHMVSPSVLNGALNVMATVSDNKDQNTNGVAGPRPLSVDLRPPAAANSSKEEVRLKPPHRDTKYLDQIYTVPKLEELPEFDDQKWLFGSNNHRTKSCTKFDTEEIPQVWAEAMQIDSAGALALPYVIPY